MSSTGSSGSMSWGNNKWDGVKIAHLTTNVLQYTPLGK
jgi:hypothetical protein